MSRGALLLIAAAVSMSGCHAADASMRMTLAGASPGGAWSAIGEAITDELRRAIPGSAFTLEPGQDGANAALVQTGRVELGLVHASIARAAIEGSFPFEAPQPDVRAIMLVYGDAPFHFIVDRRAGVRTFEELRAKRVSLRIAVNTRGSLMELATRTALEAYGIGYDDVREAGGAVLFYPLNTSFELMQRRALDAIGVTVQVPSTQTIAASRLLDFEMLSLSPKAIEFANQRLGTDAATIPREAYPFLDRDVHTFAGRVILITSSQVPEEDVYRVTQVLHARLAQLRRAHGSLKALTPETMPQVGGVPLHPGAERLYREIGSR
jgi:hypothetical protein